MKQSRIVRKVIDKRQAAIGYASYLKLECGHECRVPDSKKPHPEKMRCLECERAEAQ